MEFELVHFSLATVEGRSPRPWIWGFRVEGSLSLIVCGVVLVHFSLATVEGRSPRPWIESRWILIYKLSPTSIPAVQPLGMEVGENTTAKGRASPFPRPHSSLCSSFQPWLTKTALLWDGLGALICRGWLIGFE